MIKEKNWPRIDVRVAIALEKQLAGPGRKLGTGKGDFGGRAWAKLPEPVW